MFVILILFIKDDQEKISYVFFFIEHGGYEASKQIQNLKLNVSILWMGSQLRNALNISIAVQQPYLVLNWEPNTLTANERLQRVELPPCRYCKY